jgi:predicted membrane-bound spermidine synthase
VGWFFCFFFVSGFCSLMYEVIWLRLAMAQYGVTTPMVSVVLSTFMLGLGVGSWSSGRLIKAWKSRLVFPPLRLYALCEFLIGLSAFAVAFELVLGKRLLHYLDGAYGLSSLAYYCGTGIWIALSLLPWCSCMGATFPCALFAIRQQIPARSATSFSYLYLANVLGAMAGALLPLLLIEQVGFRKTLILGAVLNFVLAFCAFSLGEFRRGMVSVPSEDSEEERGSLYLERTGGRRKLSLVLFWTGLTSMAAEVVWIRMFTPWLGTVVYAFAAILAVYLGATYIGSWIYRRCVANSHLDSRFAAVLAFVTLIPLLVGDPRLVMPSLLRVFIGIVPFSAMLGFITPCLLDRIASGEPGAAGAAYGLNIVGCILGPLLGGFLLLPAVGERGSLTVLALSWFVIASLFAIFPLPQEKPLPGAGGRIALFATGALALLLIFSTKDFATQFRQCEVRRDYTATVIATGQSWQGKRLLVNGVGITNLTPEAKLMAHLPLVLLGRKPINALDICFGMGTTYRSLFSWGIPSTAVELVPSVPSLYGYFHKDGPHLLASPLSHVVIDDGRLYLERSSEVFDVITIDPPPPVEATGSSLLYSKEFYKAAKRRLREDGILQQWLPNGEPTIVASVVKALQDSFPYVRVFRAIEGPGLHFLASSRPILVQSPSALAAHMPGGAVSDLLEWGPFRTAPEQLSAVLTHEVSVDSLEQMDPAALPVEDDHPVNEYFLLRRLHDRAFLRKAWERLLGTHPN